MFTSLMRGGARNYDDSILENPANDLNDEKTWERVIGSERSDAGVRVTPTLALSQPALWRGINILANGISRIPVDVYQVNDDGTKERDRNHFASPFLRKKVNPFLTVKRFRRLMTFHKIFRGNGIAIIQRDQFARPVAIIPCDPCRFGVVKLTTGKLAGEIRYLIGAGNDAKILHPDNVFHVFGLSYDGMTGIDVFDLMRESLGLPIAARKFGTRFFGKGANTSGFLITPAGLSEPAVKRLESDFKKASHGLSKSFTTTLLEEGAKYQQTTVAPEQAQFLATRQFETREIASIIGVPSHLLGDKDGQAYNSLEQENASYIDHSLDPHLSDFEDEYNSKFLTEEEKRGDKVIIECNRNAAKRVDTKTETEDLNTQLDHGQLSLDEVRSIRNRSAIPGGYGKRFRMTSGTTYVDSVP